MSKKSTYQNFVSKEYRKDWQFALDMMRKPIVKPATSIIFIVPILLGILDLNFFGQKLPFQLPLTLWLSWASAIFYIIALIIYKTSCPKFIQEYRDFGEFLKRNHSHRWIVWEFYYNLIKYENWELLRESFDKEISTEATSDEIDQYFGPRGESNEEINMQKPQIEGRNIILPFSLENNKKYLLKLTESDTKVVEKEKELFWILYTGLTKQNKNARVWFWRVLFYMIVCVVLIVLGNILKVFC